MNDFIIRLNSTDGALASAGGVALLNVLDTILHSDSLDVAYFGPNGRYNGSLSSGSVKGYAVFLLFEVPSELADRQEVLTDIAKQLEYACSLDTIEQTQKHKLLKVEPCNYSLK